MNQPWVQRELLGAPGPRTRVGGMGCSLQRARARPGEPTKQLVMSTGLSPPLTARTRMNLPLVPHLPSEVLSQLLQVCHRCGPPFRAQGTAGGFGALSRDSSRCDNPNPAVRSRGFQETPRDPGSFVRGQSHPLLPHPFQKGTVKSGDGAAHKHATAVRRDRAGGRGGPGTPGTSCISVLVCVARWGLLSVGNAQIVQRAVQTVTGSSSAEQDGRPKLYIMHKYVWTSPRMKVLASEGVWSVPPAAGQPGKGAAEAKAGFDPVTLERVLGQNTSH